MGRLGCFAIVVTALFTRIAVHADDAAVWKKIAQDVNWAMDEQVKVKKLGQDLKTGKITEAQRLQMLQEKIQIFRDQLENLEPKFNAQSIVAEYIETLSKPQDTELVRPLMSELLDSEDGKRNSSGQPREIDYGTAATLGKAIAKTQAYNSFSVAQLIEKFDSISKQRYGNLSLKMGLINVLAGIDEPEALQFIFKKIQAQDDEGAGSQAAVEALSASHRAESVSILLQYGATHPKNSLTRGKALLSIGQICASEPKSIELQDLCIRTIFPKFLGLIKGIDSMSDQEALGHNSKTMAQVAFESLVDACKDLDSQAIVTACAIIPTLEHEPRIKAQFALYQLPKLLVQLRDSLQQESQAWRDYADALRDESKAWSDTAKAYGDLADHLRSLQQTLRH